MKRIPETAKLDLHNLGFFELAKLAIERGFIDSETYALKLKYQQKWESLKESQQKNYGWFREGMPKRQLRDMLDTFHQLKELKEKYDHELLEAKKAQKEIEQLRLWAQKEATAIVAKRLTTFTTIGSAILLGTSVLVLNNIKEVYEKSDNPNKTHYPQTKKVESGISLHNLSRTIATPSNPTVSNTAVAVATPIAPTPSTPPSAPTLNTEPVGRSREYHGPIPPPPEKSEGVQPPQAPNAPKPRDFTPNSQSSTKPFGGFKKI